MTLTGQRKRVYEYIRDNPAVTIREIREATNAQKCDMRISEINFAHRKEHGEDLIVNCGKTRSGEVKKMIRKPLTRVIKEPRFNANGTVTMVPVVHTV